MDQIAALTQDFTISKLVRCENPATSEIVGLQVELRLSSDLTTVQLDMIGRQSPKCYTEQVMGSIKEVMIDFSKQNVLRSFGFKTDIGQVSQSSSQGALQSQQVIKLDQNTALAGLYGSFEDTINSLGIITLDVECAEMLSEPKEIESKFLN